MMNSFLIKNPDPSFERCYQVIKRRELQREKNGFQNGEGGSDLMATKNSGKRPPARDGHTGIIINGNLFIFGGDRHHMPFNDFYMLDIRSEFEAKRSLF
jgi:hypothetical protein